MRTVVWVLVGWLGVVLWTAVAVKLAPAWVFPEAAVVVLVFLAVHREPIPLALAATALGYVIGRQAGAPVGLHETALIATSIAVYVVAGHLAGGGAVFFGVIAGLATMGYHLLLFVLLIATRGNAGFSSWATAALVFSGFATTLFALAAHRPMVWLEKRISREKHEGLQWR